MSIYEKSQTAGLHCFREATERHSSMAGVTAMRFTCPRCKKVKPMAGRKRIGKYHRDGYRCADCAKGEGNGAN